MQVVLVVGGTDYVLAHGADRAVGKHFGPDGADSHDAEKLVQVDPRLRGAYQKVQDRANLKSVLRFGVEVELASLDEAAKYMDNYAKDLPVFGVLEKRYDDGSVSRWSQAHISNVNTTRQGVTVFIRYTIVASQQSYAAPP